MAKNILRLPATMRRTGLSRSSVYRGVEKGTFPRPIKLGERMVGWLEDDVEEWLDQHIAESLYANKESNADLESNSNADADPEPDSDAEEGAGS